ncbi:MAG: alpha-ketoglutarate-dependent dioxygenase AlkB [Rhodospirillales bacterium]
MSARSCRSLDLSGGDVRLYENALVDPDRLFRVLMDEISWAQESITLFGRTHKMPRLTAWMGDVSYRYSGLTHPPAPWSDAVQEVRKIVEQIAGARFNGVLGNLYRDGQDSMGWHADDEASLGPEPVIASVNLGETRQLRFKPKPHWRDAGQAEAFGIALPPGSVLVMRGDTQANWLHAVPKSARPLGPRINLTFRWIVAAA